MKIIHSLFLVLAVASLIGCSSSDDIQIDDKEMGIITVELEPLNDYLVSTRSTTNPYADNPDRVEFTFSDKDSLGIFPNKGDQLNFPMGGAGGTSFSFDGGGWGLKKTYTYAAYIPFSKKNYDRTNKTISLVYTGQTQKALDDASHMGAYDYQASAGVSPDDAGNTHISLKRQGVIIVLKLSVPEAKTFVSATVSTGEALFVKESNLDISGTTIEYTPLEFDRKFSLLLDNITTVPNEEFRLYFMAGYPVNLSGKELTISMVTTEGELYKGILSCYYPTPATNNWTRNTRHCYSSTLSKLGENDPHFYDPEYYIETPKGTNETPGVHVDNPGTWN